MKIYKYANNYNTSSNNNSNTNYSKILDDLIYADIAEKNYFLGLNSKKTTGDKYLDKMIGLNNIGLKDDFTNAIIYLKSLKTTPTYEYGKTYYINGMPIIFFEDSIQIGFKLYYYDDFNNLDFINTLAPATKKTILTIYIDGLKITIKK